MFLNEWFFARSIVLGFSLSQFSLPSHRDYGCLRGPPHVTAPLSVHPRLWLHQSRGVPLLQLGGGKCEPSGLCRMSVIGQGFRWTFVLTVDSKGHWLLPSFLRVVSAQDQVGWLVLIPIAPWQRKQKCKTNLELVDIFTLTWDGLSSMDLLSTLRDGYHYS